MNPAMQAKAWSASTSELRPIVSATRLSSTPSGREGVYVKALIRGDDRRDPPDRAQEEDRDPQTLRRASSRAPARDRRPSAPASGALTASPGGGRGPAFPPLPIGRRRPRPERFAHTWGMSGYRLLNAEDAFWRESNQMGVLNTDLAKQLERGDARRPVLAAQARPGLDPASAPARPRALRRNRGHRADPDRRRGPDPVADERGPSRARDDPAGLQRHRRGFPLARGERAPGA